MLNRVSKLILSVLLIALTSSLAFAGDRGIFKDKKEEQHELSDKEERRLVAEFKAKFSSAKAGAFQKMNSNPWAAKKNRDQAPAYKDMKLSDSWGSCREYAYKQRGQCYVKGSDAYRCERLYDGRVKLCDDKY